VLLDIPNKIGKIYRLKNLTDRLAARRGRKNYWASNKNVN